MSSVPPINSLCVRCHMRPYQDFVRMLCIPCLEEEDNPAPSSTSSKKTLFIPTTTAPKSSASSSAAAPKPAAPITHAVARPIVAEENHHRVNLAEADAFRNLILLAQGRRHFHERLIEIIFGGQRLAVLQTPENFANNYPYAFGVMNGEINYTLLRYEDFGRLLSIYQANIIKMIADAVLKVLRGRTIKDIMYKANEIRISDAIVLKRLNAISHRLTVFSVAQLIALLVGTAACEAVRSMASGVGFLNMFKTFHTIKHLNESELPEALLKLIFPSSYRNERLDSTRHATGFAGSQAILENWPKPPPKYNTSAMEFLERYRNMASRDINYFSNWDSGSDEKGKDKVFRKARRHWISASSSSAGPIPKRGKIQHDGHCLFRALGYFLPGYNTSNASVLRLRSLIYDNYLRLHGRIDNARIRDMEEMEENVVWGGEEEIIFLSHILNVHIRVHFRDRATQTFSGLPGQGLINPESAQIIDIYFDEAHFDVVQFWS